MAQDEHKTDSSTKHTLPHLSIYACAKKSPDELLKELNSTMNGLSDDEVQERIKFYGQNALAEKKKINAALEYLRFFLNPLIIILLSAAAVSAYFGETINAIIIGIIVLVSVTLNFFQEHQADKAAKKLKEKVVTTATTIRAGERKEVLIRDLTVGDIIFLSAGDLVPADSRVLEARDFFVNESSLTGESIPSEKRPEITNSEKKSLGELTNVVYLGTNVVSGTATCIVVKTGASTEFGKISVTLTGPRAESDFDKNIKGFGFVIMNAVIFLALFIFLFNALFKHEILQSLLFAVAIAVGLTPGLLPMIISINMAKGSVNMAKKGVIVKRLSSIPNFGSMDVLCTDKTGTLTEDKITLVKYVDVTGKDNSEVLYYAHLNSFYQTGIKNPLDNAVLDFKGYNALDNSRTYKKIDEIPFDFIRRKISVVVEKDKKRLLITKGAPEEIIKTCSHYTLGEEAFALDTDEERAEVLKEYLRFSREGFRVIAVAIKSVDDSRTVYTKDDENNMMLVGYVSFYDPPKKDVKQVLTELKNLGVDIKVITGDNELVTQRICSEIELHVKGVLLGSEMVHLTDDALRVRVENTTIFARFSPNEKNRVILALKANGKVVGYLGDGINDAPSLRTADVGISVNTAVDIAKESADIILTHKSLKALEAGVIEGRKTHANTMKYILMGLSSNFGNMFSMLAAVLFLPFLPMLPVQILLNNLIYDASQITLPSDHVDLEHTRKPRRWNMEFIKRFMWTFGPISSAFDIITFLVLYFLFRAQAGAFQTGWFLESLATQTLVICIIRTKRTPFWKSKMSKYLLLTTIGGVILGWTLPYTPIGKYFGFTPLPLNIILAILGIVLVYLVVVEFVKKKFYEKYDY